MYDYLKKRKYKDKHSWEKQWGSKMELLLDYHLRKRARLLELGLVGHWALTMALEWALSTALD